MSDLDEYLKRNLQYEKLTAALEKAINFYGPYIKTSLVENQCNLLLSDKQKRKRAGEFYPLSCEIHLYNVRENLNNETLECIYVHELAHFLDRLRKPSFSRYRYASSSRSSKERAIITLFRSKMVPFPEKRTNYRGRTCELFARSIEEFYAIKTDNSNWIEKHQNWDYYVNISEFKKTIYPVVDDYLKSLK